MTIIGVKHLVSRAHFNRPRRYMGVGVSWISFPVAGGRGRQRPPRSVSTILLRREELSSGRLAACPAAGCLMLHSFAMRVQRLAPLHATISRRPVPEPVLGLRLVWIEWITRSSLRAMAATIECGAGSRGRPLRRSRRGMLIAGVMDSAQNGTGRGKFAGRLDQAQNTS